MRFACYSRKSVYSDRSDSVDNQFRMCRDYADMRFPGRVDSFERYSDEDFTGANTDRPDLKRLLADIEAGCVDALVVYQLDRLSRDVRDFSNIYALLEEKRVMFVSIKENIDTATPIGRAMMYVTVVFAQMERETTAARVTDNMVGLAKKGYWVGGNPPYGYRRVRIEAGGRKHVSIEPVPEQAEYVKRLFSFFLDGGYSLQGMETAFKRMGVKSPNGCFFSSTQLHQMLTSPFAAEATGEVYDYFAGRGCIMEDARALWDGSHGVMVYGRTTERNKKHRKTPPSEWHVCVGYHEPFLSAGTWLAVQARFRRNVFDRTMKYEVPLLKGVLRCSCGSLMAVSRKKHVDGSVMSWYYCVKRMRKGAEYCPDSHQIKCSLLDDKVLEVLKGIAADRSLIMEYAAASEDASHASQDAPRNVSAINADISSTEERIGRLAANLALAEGSTAARYIVGEMERLDLELAALKRELEMERRERRDERTRARSVEAKADEIAALIEGFEGFSDKERNAIVKEVLRECTWDGSELFLRF